MYRKIVSLIVNSGSKIVIGRRPTNGSEGSDEKDIPGRSGKNGPRLQPIPGVIVIKSPGNVVAGTKEVNVDSSIDDSVVPGGDGSTNPGFVELLDGRIPTATLIPDTLIEEPIVTLKVNADVQGCSGVHKYVNPELRWLTSPIVSVLNCGDTGRNKVGWHVRR